MGWPCRRELWGDQLGHAKADYAATANAVAAFEPLTMVCAAPRGRRRGARGADRRRRGRRAGDRRLLAARQRADLRARRRRAARRRALRLQLVGREVHALRRRRRGRRPADRPPGRPPLRGAVRARGRVGRRRRRGHAADDRAVPAAPQPQPGDDARGDRAGAARLPGRRARGVARARAWPRTRTPTATSTSSPPSRAPARCCCRARRPGTPSSERMADNRSRLVAAGLDVVDFPILPTLEVGGEEVAVGHLNFYLCNGAAIVPVAGAADRRRGARAHRRRLPRPRGRRRPGRGHRLRRRRPALHHPAGPRRHRRLTPRASSPAPRGRRGRRAPAVLGDVAIAVVGDQRLARHRRSRRP